MRLVIGRWGRLLELDFSFIHDGRARRRNLWTSRNLCRASTCVRPFSGRRRELLGRSIWGSTSTYRRLGASHGSCSRAVGPSRRVGGGCPHVCPVGCRGGCMLGLEWRRPDCRASGRRNRGPSRRGGGVCSHVRSISRGRGELLGRWGVWLHSRCLSIWRSSLRGGGVFAYVRSVQRWGGKLLGLRLERSCYGCARRGIWGSSRYCGRILRTVCAVDGRCGELLVH